MDRAFLFAKRLDAASFAAYLLGAVLPLAFLGLAVVPEHPVLPRSSWAAALVGLAFVSLGAFFALRRLAHGALHRMDSDNTTLETLLSVSAGLSTATDESAALAAALPPALALTGAESGFLVESGRENGGVAGWLGTTEVEARAAAWELRGAIDSCQPGSDLVRESLADTRHAALIALGHPGGNWRGVMVIVSSKPLTPASGDALEQLGALLGVGFENAALRQAQRNFFAHVTALLSRTLDAHLDHHEGHGHRVAAMANRVGHALELPPERLAVLHWSSLLHDVGFLGIPRWLHEDVSARRRHPRLGAEMLAPIQFWAECAPIVRAHHERPDGTGYPEGLPGDAIPIEARILSVCDAFDAMVTGSDHSGPRTPEKALDELRAGSGTQFDPAAVDAFLRLAAEGVFEMPETVGAEA